MGLSSPSGHKPQRPSVQLEHVLELLNTQHIRTRRSGSRGDLAISQNWYPGSLSRLYAAARWELVGHRYVHIEERTEGAGWLVLRRPTSVNLW